MKKIQLLSILILFISFFGVQSVVGQTTTDGNGTSTSSDGKIRYTTTAYINTTYTVQNEISQKKNLTINLKYPSNYISFQACAQNIATSTKTISIKGNGSSFYTTPTLKNNSTSWFQEVWDAWTDYSSNNIPQNATQIVFESNGGNVGRYIRNIYIHMAPHILLKEITGDGTKTLGTGTATSTETATIDFGEMLNTANPKTATIKIKSCLSAGALATTLSESNTPSGFSITGGVSGEGNTFVPINNGNDIIVTFDPRQAGVTTTTGSQTITETITISDAGNTGNNVVIYLTAKVNPPKSQTITWPEFTKTLRIGDVITLNATATSGLDITYTSNNTNIATINGDKMTIVGAGEATITASQGGNAEYAAAPEKTKTITTKQYNVSNLRSTETGYKYIKLSWDAIDRADSYSIYEGDTEMGRITETNYTISGLDYATTHTYTIKTNDADSYTPQSSGTDITITTKPFPQVSNLTATNILQNKITISWTAPTMANGHRISQYYVHLYKNPTTEENYVENYYVKPPQNTLVIENLIDNTTYDVHVGVEYIDNEGKTITIEDWNEKDYWVHLLQKTTTSFIPTTPFNGTIMYKGEWYRVHLNENIEIANGENNLNPHTMNLDYPCETFRYEAWISNRAGAEHSVIVKDNNDNEIDNKKLNNNKFEGGYLENNKYIFGPSRIATNISSIIFSPKIGNTGAQKIYVKNMGAKIAPHIRLKPLETNTLETVIEATQNLPLDVNFKSFLAMGNMTITSNNPQFLIDGNLESKTIECGANYLCKTDNTSHNFSIVYIPKSVGTHKATITITDGTSTETIELTGICKKKTPTITWVANKQLVYGTNLADAASSDCGTAITYTSANEDIIKIVDNELKPVGLGKVNITATTAGDDKYESIHSTAEFEVVDKDIQIVVWDQNFYLLKLGDANTTLNAYTKDKETGKRNNLPIEYSSANTNIVTVNDGVLHIVGKGQTSITAHQCGNDQYAGIYMTKTVIVREVSDDCSSSYAFDVPALVEKGDDSFWGGFTTNQIKETHNLNTIGDKLSFRTTCNNASISHSIRVTDQSDNLIYDGDFGEVKDIPLSRDVTSLNFFVQANFRITLSDIIVTQATYLEARKKTVSFQTQYGATGNASIFFDWANQPAFIWAKIIDDANGVFSIVDADADGTKIIEATCGTYDTDFVNIEFKPTAAGNYTAKLVLGVGASEEIKETIDITATAHKGYQAITWTDALTTADRQVQIAKSDKNIPILYKIISGTGAEVTNNGSRISVIKANTFTVRAYNEGSNNYNPISAEKEFTSTIGTIKFDNSNGNNSWNNSANWLPINTLNTQRNVEPSAVVNAVISAKAEMNDVDGEINNLTFENGGKLTVNPTSGLKANEVTNATANNLILKASADGNATFIYNSGTPSATVEMYSKATGAVNNGTPQWQYMGVAVDGATTSNFPNAWLLKWTEAENVTGDPWSDAPLAAGTTLAPWTGYSISQPQATTYTTKGALMSGDHTYTLTRTTREGDTQDPDCGFNLLANSYTAPIDITKLTTSDFVNADACIILYNTGTYEQWADKQGTSGENPGQLTVIPVNSAKAISLPTTIPSMQAFFVMAQENGATFTVNYENAVANTDRHSNQMRAPRAENEFNVLKIMIEGENTRDRLYLLENEETSKAYDNGYEARKIFDAPRGHQMYATCEYGYASIDCSESFVGQTIGLKGDNEGEMLTISFDIDRLEGYESLYLYDKVTGKYVNIVAGEKYIFFGVKGADDNRFSIVTNPDDRNQTPPFVVIGEELAFDKSQINADNANIYIYDTSGRLLIIDKVNPYENYNIPNMPKGIYLVSMNGYTTKIVKK